MVEAEVRVGIAANRLLPDVRRQCGGEAAAHGIAHVHRAEAGRHTVASAATAATAATVATVAIDGIEQDPVTDPVVLETDPVVLATDPVVPVDLVLEGRLDPVGMMSRTGEVRSFAETAVIATRCPGALMGRLFSVSLSSGTAGTNAVVSSVTAPLTGATVLICRRGRQAHRGRQARCLVDLLMETTFGVPIYRASVTTTMVMDASPTAQNALAHLDGMRHLQPNNWLRPYLRAPLAPYRRALLVPHQSRCRRRPQQLPPRSNSRPPLSGLLNSSCHPKSTMISVAYQIEVNR